MYIQTQTPTYKVPHTHLPPTHSLSTDKWICTHKCTQINAHTITSPCFETTMQLHMSSINLQFSYINSRSTHSTVTEFIYHYTHTLTHTTWLVLQTVYARKCMCICECVCIACLCVVPCLLCTWVDECVLRRMTWFSFSHKHLDWGVVTLTHL